MTKDVCAVAFERLPAIKPHGFRFDFNPAWEEVKVQDVRVITANQEVHKLDKRAVNVMDAGWVGSAPRYPAGKTLVVSFPSVDIGSIIEFTLLIKQKNRASFQLCEPFQDFEPIGLRRVSINAPRDLPLEVDYSETGFGLQQKWWRIPEDKAELKVSSQKGIKTYQVRKEHVPPLPEEGNVPPLFSFCPTLVAKSASWPDLARDFKQALAEKMDKPAKRTESLAASLASIEDKRQRILAIRDFVAENIRPVGPDFDQVPLSAMSSPEDTLQDGYGNSADRALLLLKLLKLNGFDAQLVLQAELPGVPALNTILEKSSGLNWFNQVLVQVRAANGQKIYLNSSGEYARLGTTQSQGLAGFYPQEGKIARIAVSKEELKTAMDIDLDIKLLNNGDARLRLCREYFGMDYAAFKAKISSFTPAERKHYTEGIITDLSKSAELKGKYEIDVHSYPARECFEIFVPDFAPLQDGLMLVDIPLLITDISGADSEYRELPLLRPESNRKQVDITFELPENMQRIISRPLNSRRVKIPQAGLINCKYVKKDQNTLHFSQKGELKPMILLPYQYPQLLKIQNDLARPENTTLVLEMEHE